MSVLVTIIVIFFLLHFISNSVSGSLNGPRPQSRTANQDALFVEQIFSMLGKVAKADGVVSPDEINATEQIIKILRLSQEMRKAAIRSFTEARDSTVPFEQYAAQFKASFGRQPEILQVAFNILFQLASADRHISAEEEALLLQAANVFGIHVRFETNTGGSQSPLPQSQGQLQAAFEVLELPATSDMKAVKKRHRELVKKFHPDKLASQGLPKEFEEFATDKVAEINAAYEVIQRHIA